MNIAKVIVLSSCLTTVIIGGLLYIGREPLRQYLRDDSSWTLDRQLAVSASTQIPDMIDRVNDAVVSVVATKDVPIYERYYEEYNPFNGWFGGFSVPRVRENGTEERQVAGGTGFLVSADGLIVTNRHVVADDEARYSVVFTDGTSQTVTILAKDPVLDISVLKLESTPTTSLPYLLFATSTVRLGESVVAIGNALAEFRNSVSVGIISGLSRSIEATDGLGTTEQLTNVLQTDAAINPGNSGGPLLNLHGEVVGVNVAASLGAENIGFAIPADVVTAVVSSVKQYGEIKRPYLGVRYAMVTPGLQSQNNLPVDYGALIIRGNSVNDVAVASGSPADTAGLRENDIILAINDVSLRDRDLATVLRQFAIDTPITVRFLSQGTEKTVSLTLSTMPN